MKKFICVLILAFCSNSIAITNGGFEQSINVGWTTQGYSARIVQSFEYYDLSRSEDALTLSPAEGNSFAVLASGGRSQELNYTTISQNISLNAGNTISGMFFFATKDYDEFNDEGYVKLIPLQTGLSEILLIRMDVATVGNRSATDGWVPFSYTLEAGEAGSYGLVCNVHDLLDYIEPSYVAVDGLVVTPEPVTSALLLLGFAGLLRRRTSR